eukprot:CAMPEP_0175552006 /NCGR_PEP_ID=MMETSP0096-20121207/32616_1 /TAXON_ID=311494 /ORGANISM="Alexandrium monilatum, Strain CCMP3105" /LENGTH=79 /DNA_ID=CAMNT_0016855069 /DNA_START=273 /DNA_END=508 /DNA_ORIENTATION=-
MQGQGTARTPTCKPLHAAKISGRAVTRLLSAKESTLQGILGTYQVPWGATGCWADGMASTRAFLASGSMLPPSREAQRT